MTLIFLPYLPGAGVENTIDNILKASPRTQIVLLTPHGVEPPHGLKHLECHEGITATSTLQAIAHEAEGSHCDSLLLYTKTLTLSPGYGAIERIESIMSSTGAHMLYSDYIRLDCEGRSTNCPVLDLQLGSVRDDFNFGPLLAFNPRAFIDAANGLTPGLQSAALYEMRLSMARRNAVLHINERLYTCCEHDNRLSGEKNFDYVDPRNRSSQIEMEQVCTRHLKAIDAWLAAYRPDTDLTEGKFPIEASVIIPVKNRRRTITQAIDSVLSQETNFSFNVIVIDNYSTDGTTELIAAYAENDPRVVHLIPERNDLGIGGCWNYGVNHAKCGRFALQLDSDDIYSNPHVIKRIVEEFYKQKCAMLIGSYSLTDFDGNPLPPGVIDHREWTDDNGPNNALRINGLGAPRCFFTPVLRANPLPNVSYGEDYAAALAISRRYRIGRIFDVLYLCRRWEGNSDAALTIEQQNRNNHYKDSVRTQEIMARIKLNKG